MSVEVLKKVPLFDGLDDATLSNLFTAGETFRYTPNEYVIRQGEYGDCLFVVLNGRINIQAYQSDGLLKNLVTLGPGDYFGEMAMLGLGERTASALS